MPSMYREDDDPYVGPADVTSADVQPPGDATDVSWWRNVAERALRQAYQVAAPILAVVVASGNGLDWGAFLGAIIVAVALTVLKAAAGVTADANRPKAVQLADRALSALAFTLAGFVPVDWADWGHVDWGKVFTAAVTAAALAAIQFYVNPPRFAVHRGDYATAA